MIYGKCLKKTVYRRDNKSDNQKYRRCDLFDFHAFLQWRRDLFLQKLIHKFKFF